MQNLAAGELLLGGNLGLFSGAKKLLVSGRVMSTHPVEILARLVRFRTEREAKLVIRKK